MMTLTAFILSKMFTKLKLSCLLLERCNKNFDLMTVHPFKYKQISSKIYAKDSKIILQES